MIKRQKAGKGETAAAAAVAAAAAGSSLSLDGRSASSSAATGGTSSHAAASLNIATLLSDLAAIRKHQTAISADLKDLQARNHALWQEAVQSREKHKKQEETINKILRFLAGVFGGQVLDAGAAAHPQVVEGAASPMSTTSSAASPPQTGGTAAANATTGKAGGGTNGSATTTGGSGSSGTRKGNGHSGAGVVLMPKSRLLLEDVKGRQRQRRAALRELDGEDDEGEEEEDVDDDEERLGGRSRRQPRPRRRRVKTEGEEEERNEDNGVEIEEIPLLNAAEDEEDMPVISSGKSLSLSFFAGSFGMLIGCRKQPSSLLVRLPSRARRPIRTLRTCRRRRPLLLLLASQPSLLPPRPLPPILLPIHQPRPMQTDRALRR